MIHRALIALVLAGFLALTARALLVYGYIGFFEITMSSGVTQQLFIDLVICLTLVAVWIYHDARRIGITPWPFIATGGLFGVAGPLAYLLRRPRGEKDDALEKSFSRVPPTLAALVLLGFLAFTVLVLDRHGYAAFLLYSGANEATELLFVDLSLSLIVLAVGIVRDARSRRASYLPFLLLTLFFGSAGPLLYLLTRGFSKARQRAFATVAIGMAAVAMTLGSGHADLRNETVRRAGPDAESRGRGRLQQLAERHGLSALGRHETMETVARDVWPQGGPWWPEDDQRFLSHSILGTFTSRVELLDGRGAGEVRGIQAWSPYRKANGAAAASFLAEPDPAITFYLPTLQYFNELPFRILSATVVRDAGEARHRGRVYELIFATWRSAEPQDDLDQYVLWIDRETGLLAKVRYTVRDAVPRMPQGQRKLFRSVVMGTMHYEDYREIDGVLVPFVQTVTIPPPELTRYPLSENFFHRLTLEKADFDTVPRHELILDPARGEPGDRKPETE